MRNLPKTIIQGAGAGSNAPSYQGGPIAQAAIQKRLMELEAQEREHKAGIEREQFLIEQREQRIQGFQYEIDHLLKEDSQIKPVWMKDGSVGESVDSI